MLFFKLFNWDENIVVSENITYKISPKPKDYKKNTIIDEILENDPFFFSY